MDHMEKMTMLPQQNFPLIRPQQTTIVEEAIPLVTATTVIIAATTHIVTVTTANLI